MCLKVYVELKLDQSLQVIPTVIQLYCCKKCDPYCVVLLHCFSIHLCVLVNCLTHGRKQWLPRCSRNAPRLTLQIIVHLTDKYFLQVNKKSDHC